MPDRPAAAVILLGCPKNRVDAESTLASLGRAGYALTADLAAADVAVVTTCAFLRSAVRESEAAIRRALAARRRNPALRVVVAGCLVQRYGRRLHRRFPEVELLAGVDYLAEIPRLLKVRAGYACSESPSGTGSPDRLISTPRHYAYLRVADGCDNRCSYCLIPDIRGRFRSRRLPDIAAEAGRLARAGARELILVAQDTTAYGRDTMHRLVLPRLIDRLAALPGVAWLRLMYAHPVRFTDELVARFSTASRLCRYVDLPVQHAADRVLAAMNRGYSRADLERLIARLRAVPGMRLRTTVIVGFPGETDAEFRELLDFLRAVEFDRLGAYAYSAEAGTPAARLRPRVPAPVLRERLERVIALQSAISRRRLRALRGRTVTIIADMPDIGRTEWDAPEVDGVVRLSGPPATPGQFHRVLVTGSDDHDLHGRVTAPTDAPARD
ncbi:MAG: 30S ribosomal protein S12 methylthiotransferase RimO [bacterium]